MNYLWNKVVLTCYAYCVHRRSSITHWFQGWCCWWPCRSAHPCCRNQVACLWLSCCCTDSDAAQGQVTPLLTPYTWQMLPANKPARKIMQQYAGYENKSAEFAANLSKIWTGRTCRNVKQICRTCRTVWNMKQKKKQYALYASIWHVLHFAICILLHNLQIRNLTLWFYIVLCIVHMVTTYHFAYCSILLYILCILCMSHSNATVAICMNQAGCLPLLSCQ